MTRRLFGSLLGLVFLVSFGRVVFAPLLEPLQTAFGVGPAAVGTVASLAWLGTALPRIPVGYLLTRVPRHYVVVTTGLLLAVASALTASASSMLELQVGAFLVGTASGAYFVAAVPLVGELYPERTGRAIGIHGTSTQMAAVIAPAVVVAVLAAATWRETFWLLAGFALVATAVLLVVLRRNGVPSTAGPDRDFLGALAHWRIVAAGVLMVAIAGFVWLGLFNFYVSYLLTKGLSSEVATTGLTIIFAAGLPAFWFSGRLADRFPHVPYILTILGGFVLSVVAFTLVKSTLSVILVTVAIGYSIHSLFPALDAYMLETLPAANRASAYSLFSGLALLIEANGSGAVGILTEAGYSFDTVFRGLAVIVGVVLVALVILYQSGRLPGNHDPVNPST